MAPSVIGYYDRLSTGIEQIIALPLSDSKLSDKPDKPPVTVKPNYSVPALQRSHTPSPTQQNSTAQLKHKNFRVLSQKVQRIISHSGSESDILATTHPNIDHETSAHIINSTKYFKRIGSLKNKHTNIPLSKNTCKLTQAGNELVDTLDAKIFSSNDSLNELVENKRLLKAIPSIHHHEPPKIIKSSNIQKIIQRLQSVNHSQTDDEIDDSNNMSNDENHSGKQCRPAVEAVNYLVKIPSDLVDSEDFKNLQINDVNSDADPIDDTAPTIESILENGNKDDEHQGEAEDQSANRISLPKDVTESPFNNKSSLTIPDIARLKHRPLSASSICSTSSSSSSGSENSTSKIGVSYLASVESLADQSENELISGNMTLCERACREIIDSERTYVDDLGQVIKG